MDKRDIGALTHDYNDQVMTLVQQNHDLETVRLPIDKGSQGVVRTLCGLSNLTSLALTTPGGSMGVTEILEVLVMVFGPCNLKILRLSFEAMADSNLPSDDEQF